MPCQGIITNMMDSTKDTTYIVNKGKFRYALCLTYYILFLC